MGGEGSGRSRSATDAVELLLAAILRNDKPEIDKCIKKLDVARKHGASKMAGAKIFRLLRLAATQLAFEVSDAVANPGEHLGDLKVSLGDGSSVWIEVKGQTKKQRFADITQADYVRDGTDFLRAMFQNNADFSRLFDAGLRDELGIDAPLTFTRDWSLADLWMADLALLENETKKMRAGVRTPRDLTRFMEAKYLVHLTMEGVRYLKIANLRPVAALKQGQSLHVELDTRSKSKVAAIRLAVGCKPGNRSTDFTYHIGYKNSLAPGRHKLHSFALSEASNIAVFR